ncbi:MAG: hypothetical protein COB02_15830 [Candidatus Cloacimonadota bacterium]|nr:MAG: hypothetical protein COB02_15830 [Candidatus Cloacimonadota bacterium]
MKKTDLPKLKKRIDEATKIVFHKNSHLDDAAAQWFLRDIVKVSGNFEFQPNNKLKIDASKNEIGLDVIHPEAVKGYQSEDGTYSSVFRCVVDAYFEDGSSKRNAIESMVLWVDGDDSTGSATKAILGERHDLLENVGLTNMFAAYKARFFEMGDEVINDEYGKQILTPLFDHLLNTELARDIVRNECEIYVDGTVGVCVGHVPAAALGFPQKEAIALAKSANMTKPSIFLYRDPKIGMGMIRIDDNLRLDDTKLKDFISEHGGDGWFFHPSGFLTACGSMTVPCDLEKIPLKLEALVNTLNDIYGE